ncbi:MAG: hypothetical protein M1826_001504 [Phylliscum demangeonii]|nr:MAG: hypothetical protein M1826_001504 [Phylliscum demangeonii]
MTTAPDTENAVPLSGPAVKIMRRGKLGRDGSRADARRGSPLDSEKPSQPASELDDDTETGDIPDTGGVNGKDKSSMTREQREAKYKEARERIFKGFEETEVEEGNAVADQFKQTSRSSSEQIRCQENEGSQ